ncbi:hypothetical protein COU78_02410 [Candidatus Peregrinibacteria bacterium CG10_big_fil_rev_8_21_14_0_10_49_24]|nr:MAG: hypothetical protein COV83_02390 [Candidatus Peregrinibacteria bacterium CG11_big_fil_rev_8_21_14_0_20_49_14]PIR50990.1 MAG: hypothetical protein COU78_02410 [Candidatus Peregrinibacteria bacterium CG10_big_fil_rev_8_21_14_0_10_49_24]PJA67543.1 MAG: hypothetical protein CO157_03890 [Candidatus Peregrinibacteria bacterium CG_4_9_14_3_um_filter_49_12]
MKTRTLVTGSVLLASLCVPLSTLAAEQRRNYSDYWYLTSDVENKVAIVKELPELQKNIELAKAQLEQVHTEYGNLLDGLRYESATLERERESLESTSVQQLLKERDILGRFSIVGAPSNHLKLRARQWKLEDAQKILDEERVHAFQDLEKKERMLAREIEKTHSDYLAKRQSAQERLNIALARLNVKELQLNYAKSDKRNVFLDTITVTEKNAFLHPRISAYKQERAQKAEQIRLAMERARQNKYLGKVQPEVEQDMLRQQQEEEEYARKMLEKQLAESLGSNLSSKALKIHFLQRFLESLQK